MCAKTYLLSLFLLLLLAIFSTSLEAQTREEGPWWPHPIWGADDQAGGSNWITPEKVLRALSTVKTGKIYELGFTYHRGMPLLGDRSYSMFMPGMPTGGPYEPRGNVHIDEFLCTEIGQVGTQFDGPGHIGQRIEMQDGELETVFYNGFTLDEIRSPYELQNLGVENVKPYITKGILVDVAGYKNVDVLPDGYIVTIEDVIGTLQKQDISADTIEPGDAILFNFGWWREFGQDKYLNINYWPGLDSSVVEWLIEKKISMIGTDAAGDSPTQQFGVHLDLVMKNGIFNQEFMTFEELLEDQVHQFVFIFTPIRFKGATGSPGRPIAIH